MKSKLVNSRTCGRVNCFFIASLLLLLISPQAVCQPLPLPEWSQSIGQDTGAMVNLKDKIVIVFGCDKHTSDPTISGFDCISGQLLWRESIPRLPGQHIDNPFRSIRGKPVLHNNSLLFYTNRAELRCYKFNESVIKDKPNLVWSIDLRKMFSVFKRDDLDLYGNLPQPTPFVVDNTVVCATGNGSTLGIERFFENEERIPEPFAPSFVGVAIETGEVLWKNSDASLKVTHSSIASPISLDTEAERLVASGGDGNLYVLSDTTGKTDSIYRDQWNWSWISPTLTDGKLIVCSSCPLGMDLTSLPNVGINTYDAAKLAAGDKTALIWRIADDRYDGTYIQPMVSGKLMFVISKSAELLTIDTDNGEVLWTEKIDYEVWDCPEPIIIGGCLAVPIGSELHVYRISRDKLLVHKIDLGVPIRSTMCVVGERLFVGDQKMLHAFRIRDLLPVVPLD